MIFKINISFTALIVEINKLKENMYLNHSAGFSDRSTDMASPIQLDTSSPTPMQVQTITVFVKNEATYFFSCSYDILADVFPEIIQVCL